MLVWSECLLCLLCLMRLACLVRVVVSLCGCLFLFGWLIVCVCECPFEGSAKRKHMKMKYSSVRGFAFGVTASLHRVLIKSWDAQPFCL